MIIIIYASLDYMYPLYFQNKWHGFIVVLKCAITIGLERQFYLINQKQKMEILKFNFVSASRDRILPEQLLKRGNKCHIIQAPKQKDKCKNYE